VSLITFSIVITTFNRLEWLKRALDSALGQSVDCQVIVVDNASTDGTQAYVQNLGKRVLYIRNPQNLNHAGAVNVGVEAATGDWIKFLDDDDYLAPDCLEVMTAAIESHPKAVICSCQADQIDIEGRLLGRTATVGSGLLSLIPQADIHYGMLLEQIPFGTPVQVAVSRKAFRRSGGWDLSMTSCDDIDSWVRIAQFGDALFVNRCLAYRTLWPGGYDQKIDLCQRLNTNILIKTRIYQHIPPRHQNHLPALGQLDRYLHLHWGLIALKQGRVGLALQLALPGLLSIPAWSLLWRARQRRRRLPDLG
jgi:glycosyltransferase involved in cell wall biosynthesis